MFELPGLVCQSHLFVARKMPTYILPVRRLPTLLVILADLVKVILVQLADETGEIAVFEMLGKDGLGEFLAL